MAHGPVDETAIGRFDTSFLIHMIKDFFWILVIVTVLEFGIKAFLVWYEFTTDGAEDAAQIAEEIGQDVRAIMLNEGGPVAARTIYPIFERNWSEIGYTIAIEPSEITEESIMLEFGFDPQGIPMLEREVDATHVVGTYDLEAERLCLACHSEANVGDVLGTVTVRNYLASDFANWWDSARLTGGISAGKIIIHSILLFLLLRARLEPLMRLRATVSKLAKAYGGLDQRAEVKSADEFGALARDLNTFLDRLSGIVAELDGILRDVVRVNDDIVAIQTDLREQVDAVVREARGLERRAMLQAKAEPRLSSEWFSAMSRSVEDLDRRLANIETDGAAAGTVDELRAVVGQAEAQIRSSQALFQDLAKLGEGTEGFQRAMGEMIRLEERMKAIIASGSVLVRRLDPGSQPAE